MSEIKIGLAQLDFLWGAPEENYRKVRGWVESAADDNLDLVLFPELWASGYDLESSADYASRRDTGIFRKMQGLAEDLNLALGGSLLERDQESIYNTFYFYDRDVEAYYRKIHLFRLLQEERWLRAGDHLVTLTWKGIRVGLATCYDLRFPEMFRAYAVHGVELILLVAEWPQSRIDHWTKLLQARAIENQCFIAAVNKTGKSQGQSLGGKSALVDPWGAILAEGSGEQEMVSGIVHSDQVAKARRWIPVLEDRQPDAYQKVEEASG